MARPKSNRWRSVDERIGHTVATLVWRGRALRREVAPAVARAAFDLYGRINEQGRPLTGDRVEQVYEGWAAFWSDFGYRPPNDYTVASLRALDSDRDLDTDLLARRLMRAYRYRLARATARARVQLIDEAVAYVGGLEDRYPLSARLIEAIESGRTLTDEEYDRFTEEPQSAIGRQRDATVQFAIWRPELLRPFDKILRQVARFGLYVPPGLPERGRAVLKPSAAQRKRDERCPPALIREAAARLWPESNSG